MEISLNQYSVFLSWCVTSVVNIIIMFNIFFNEAHKENRAKDKHTLLKNHNGFGNTRGKYPSPSCGRGTILAFLTCYSCCSSIYANIFHTDKQMKYSGEDFTASLLSSLS